MQNKMVWTKLSKVFAALIALTLASSVVPGWAPSAHAQGSKKDKSKDKETAKQVLALIRQANAAFDEEDYATALEKYQAAYDLYPDPAILVRLGKTSEAMDKPKDAIGYYQEFIKLMPDDPTSAELEKQIAELQKDVPVMVTVNSTPAGARVRVDAADAAPAGTTPAEIELAPGTHTLYFAQDGYVDASTQVEVAPGKSQTVGVELERAQPQTPVAAVPAQDTTRVDLYGWSALGVGVATLATSGVFLVLKSQSEDDVNNYDKRAAGASREQLQGYKDDANSYYDIAVITGIAGGVLTATGAGLLTYHYMTVDDGDQVAVSVDAGLDSDGAWVGVNGRF